MTSYTWSFLFVFLAGLCASISSLMMRRTLSSRHGTAGGYLSFYFLVSFLCAATLNSLFTFKQPWSPTMTLLGGLTGLLVIALMITMGLALGTGPSGLTFAFQNSGSILPPLLMALLFKSAFGFSISLGNIIGMLLVIGGLFWAARTKKTGVISKRWLTFALLTFFCQAIILSIFQWRCLLIEDNLPSHPLIPFRCLQSEDLWFMPAMFFSAWCFQLIYFFYSERRLLYKAEWIGGGVGGIANGLSTCFLLMATRMANSQEKVMLFPLFAVLVILLCNLYGRIIYRESVNWAANACCTAGIFVGTLF